MSGETETQVSAWTTDTLHTHVMALLKAQEARHLERYTALENALAAAVQAERDLRAQALAATQTAVIKAEAATEKRFDSVNEFRQTLSDQAGSFVSRELADAKWKEHDNKIETLGKESTRRIDAVAANASEQIADIRSVQLRNAGAAAGSSVTIGWLFGGLAALGGIIGTVVLLANTFTSK